MKKLMIAAAIVCAAAFSQAAQFSWGGTSVIYGVDTTKVSGNGNVAIGSTKAKSDGTWTYVLAIYEAGTQNLLDSTSGTLTIGGSNKPSTGTVTLADVGDNVNVDYVMTITGVQTSLQNLGEKGGWDYSAATVEAVLTGTVTTENMGITTIGNASPTSWTVKGATSAEPVPEPTSGLLLVLGMAGLALRRRRA